MTDLRNAFRSLLKTPAFTIVAVAVLALGIGANTAVFTVLNTLLLKPLPYPNAKDLVIVQRKYPQGFGNTVSIPKFNAWRNSNQVLDHIAAFGPKSRWLISIQLSKNKQNIIT